LGGIVNKVVVSNLLLFASIFLGAAQQAQACSPPMCSFGFTIPPVFSTINRIPQLPTNIGGILWAPSRNMNYRGDATRYVALFQVGAKESKVEVSVRRWGDSGEVYLIAPKKELETGAQYELRATNLCQHPIGPETPLDISKFVANQNYALPSVLGEIKASETTMQRRSVGTSSGSCVSDVLAAEKEIELIFSPDFIPWAEAAHVTTIIDGNHTDDHIKIKLAQGLPKIAARVFHTCQTEDSHADSGLDEGGHSIAFHARLPGTDVSLTTRAFEFDLYCSPTNLSQEKNSTNANPMVTLPALGGPVVDDKTDVGCQSVGAMPLAVLILGRALMLILKRLRSNVRAG
jgi:hypothetical protein